MNLQVLTAYQPNKVEQLTSKAAHRSKPSSLCYINCDYIINKGNMNEETKQSSGATANEIKSHNIKNDGNQGFTSAVRDKPMDQSISQPTPQPATAMQPSTTSTNNGRYSGFFLTMLILASIVAFFSLFGSLFSFIAAIGFASENEPLVAIATAISPIINLLSLIALGLLYFKKSVGLYLKFIALLLAVLLAGVSAYVATNSNSFKKGVRESSYQESATNSSSLTTEELKIERKIEDFFVGSSAPIVFGSAALLASLVWNGGAGMLWFFAWRSQKKHDAIVDTAA